MLNGNADRARNIRLVAKFRRPRTPTGFYVNARHPCVCIKRRTRVRVRCSISKVKIAIRRVTIKPEGKFIANGGHTVCIPGFGSSVQ